jgi:hypothetical protein
MDGSFELHLILEKLLYLFKAVANYDLKLFFLQCENLGVPRAFFMSALFGRGQVGSIVDGA